MDKLIRTAMDEAYGKDKSGLAVRDQLILAYGEAAVQWAEVATIIQILFATGIISPSEFIDLVRKQCARADDRRRRQAGFTD